MNELKNKSLRYQIGYWFFLAVAIIGISYQLFKYLTNTLELSMSEFGLTLLFGVMMFEPMFLVKAFNAVVKSRTKKNDS